MAPTLPVLPEAAEVPAVPTPVPPPAVPPPPAAGTPVPPAPPAAPKSAPGAKPGASKTDVPRDPPRRPGPTHGVPPSRRPSASLPSVAVTRETTLAVPAEVCEGLARYGVFALNGDTHRWCLEQKQAG
ncbi:hypothetical protein [Yinghuangia sp. YIM S10712]|uniref:hypothetical protein n=1 Tax=Yinghuangia sp. YIM S10712 TaxID=3436930 RepID=UPI003F5296AF